MNRIEQVVEIASSSNHLPTIFSLLIGLFVFKKDSRIDSIYEHDSEVPGDNVPTTLLEGLYESLDSTFK